MGTFRNEKLRINQDNHYYSFRLGPFRTWLAMCSIFFSLMKRNKNQVSHDASFAQGLYPRSGKTTGCNLFVPFVAQAPASAKIYHAPCRRTGQQFYLLLSEAARLTNSPMQHDTAQ